MLHPVVHARVAAALAAVAIAFAVFGAWPGAGMPAWPAAVLGLGAVAMGLRPGPVLARAVATLGGAVAGALGAVQIALLWALGLAVS